MAILAIQAGMTKEGLETLALWFPLELFFQSLNFV